MHPGFTAVTLAMTIVFATVGTILRVGPPPSGGVEAAASARASDPNDALRHLYVRAERGFERLAGQASSD